MIHIAFSGGTDSTALALWAMGQYGTVVLLHFNHGWSASDTIQAHCEKAASKVGGGVPIIGLDGGASILGLPMQIGQAKSTCLTETKARNERYAFFDSTMPADGVLAMGHNLEEQIETVIFQISRGTENPCIKSLSERRVETATHGHKYQLYRPFLSTPKAQLAALCKEHGIQWFEDPTNAETANSHRNLIRHTIIPTIKQINARGLQHWAEYLEAKEEAETPKDLHNQPTINTKELDPFNNLQLSKVLAEWCKNQESPSLAGISGHA